MVDDRLVRYLENPATREAAAIIAASWAHHQDSERLTKDLDFLEEEVAKRQPPEPEPIDEARLNAFVRKVRAFDSRFAAFTGPILDAAVKGELDYAEDAFARLEEHVKSIQQGSDTPLSVRWRGEFEASVLYKPGDLVTLNGSAFVCVSETSSKPSGISREWDLLSSVISGPAGAAGLPGSQGPQGPQGPPGVGTAVTFQEVDGVPSGTPDTLIFPNGTLTDNLDGSYTYSPAALGSITIEEVDGVPTGTPGTLKFPNGSLTDNGDGSFTYTAPAGGAIDVTDGTTTVSPATSLAFGASMVTDSGGGVATISNSHDLLSAVSADDHHAQSHAHNGADSSGTVAHSATTGQTANDHHSQSHSDTDHSDGPNAKPGHAHSTHSSIGPNDHHNQAHKTEHEPGGGDAMTVDALAATGSLRTLGTGAQQAAAGNDSRLSDARTPTAHHTSHEVGQSDAVAITHAQTTGQTANDHHAQSHTHASHTSIGADDHHAQNHNLVDTTGHPVSGLTTGHYLKALSATTFGFAALPATPITPVVNVYTANDTWTKPANATMVFAICIGGGGGGGSGRKGATSTDRFGGGGGAGGNVSFGFFQAATVAVGGTEAITVGAQVNGGNAVTANGTNGNPGTLGNDSKFGSWLTGKGGSAAGGGTATTGSPGVMLNYDAVQIFGSATQGATTPANGGGSVLAGIARSGSGGFTGGGGGGGAIDGATNTSKNGGGGGNGTGGAGGTGGSGGGGGTGTDAAGGGGGGGGRAYNFLSQAVSAGGDGGEPGGGGGGGGAGLDSTSDSGAGGKGAKGRVVVITW